MAPERLEGKGASTASDVFSLGHVFGEIWGEKRRFPNSNLNFEEKLHQVYRQSLTAKFDSELIHLDGPDKEITNELLLSMLACNPDVRPTPSEVYKSLLETSKSLESASLQTTYHFLF